MDSKILLGLAGVLILAILALLFRVQQLIAVARGSHENRGGLSNKVNAALFLVFFIPFTIWFIWYSVTGDWALPQSASEHGVWTDDLFFVTIVIISIVFIFTNFLLFIFAFKYQYKEGNKATYFPDNHILELAWTVVPAIVLTYLVFNGWQVWTKITTPPSEEQQKEAVKLEIVGQQFAWIVRYPGADGELGKHDFREISAENAFGIKVSDKAGMDDFQAPKIYLAKGRKAQFKIRAKDVLHSVFAPHFRVKMDAVPGMPTQFWFTPTITTSEMKSITNNPDFVYEIACTEICGAGHNSMRFEIVVVEPDVYDKWYKDASKSAWSKGNEEYILGQLTAQNAGTELINEMTTYLNELNPSELVEEEEVESVQVDTTGSDIEIQDSLVVDSVEADSVEM